MTQDDPLVGLKSEKHSVLNLKIIFRVASEKVIGNDSVVQFNPEADALKPELRSSAKDQRKVIVRPGISIGRNAAKS